MKVVILKDVMNAQTIIKRFVRLVMKGTISFQERAYLVFSLAMNALIIEIQCMMI